MKVKNIVNCLTKLGLNVKIKKENHGVMYICKNEKYVLDWTQQEHCGDHVISVYIKRIKDEEDYWRDSYVGSFYHTIKSIKQRMEKDVKRQSEARHTDTEGAA